MTTYETKDSGQHQEYDSGMRRDSQDGKPRFDLIRTKLQPYEEQMITRYARLLARGAEKYSARNWEEGCGEEELERAKASLLRHTEQLVAGETDEDHAAAVWFNAQAVEYFRWRLESPQNDGLTGRERLAKATRDSEINRLALQKATEIRRRERIQAAAVEMMADAREDEVKAEMRVVRTAGGLAVVPVRSEEAPALIMNAGINVPKVTMDLAADVPVTAEEDEAWAERAQDSINAMHRRQAEVAASLGRPQPRSYRSHPGASWSTEIDQN